MIRSRRKSRSVELGVEEEERTGYLKIIKFTASIINDLRRKFS